MNNKFLYRILIITCILVCLNNCITKKIPAIQFEESIYNFGEVNAGDEVTYTFTYLNPGTDVLKITSVKPTCGCTVTGDYTKEVAPGKSGEIPVVFETKDFQGHVSKTIKVETNIPDSEPVILTLEGDIKVLIEVDTEKIWLGQTNIDGPPLTKTVTIKNHGDIPLEIIEIKSTGEGCTTEINTIKEGEEYTIDITVSPPFKMKYVEETLLIKTNIKEKEWVGIKYRYYGIPDLEVSPGEIIIRMNQFQPDLEQVLSVRSYTEETFDIINPRILNGKNIEVTLKEIIPGKYIQLVLYFPEKFKFPENETPTLTFKVKNEQGETEYTVPIRNGDTL